MSPTQPRGLGMAARIAELLGIEAESVNVKAKTGERVGPIGREEAIGADAVVLLSRANSNTKAAKSAKTADQTGSV